MIISYTHRRKVVGFLTFFSTKAKLMSLDVSGLPYAIEFDPVRQKAKLLKIKECEDNLVPFKVLKATKKGRWPITEFDHFPLEDEVMAAVYEDYGGGKYDVWAGHTLLKSYQFPGESRGNLASEAPKGKPRGFKSRIEDQVADEFEELLEEDPLLRQYIMRCILQRHFSVGIEPEPDPLDQKLDAEIQNNPDYKRAAGLPPILVPLRVRGFGPGLAIISWPHWAAKANGKLLGC
jgi:hypothetical protein